MLFIDLELALSFPHKAISKPWLAVRSHTVFFLLVVRVKGQVPVTQRSLDQDRYPLLVVVFLVKRLLELVVQPFLLHSFVQHLLLYQVLLELDSLGSLSFLLPLDA